MFIVKLCYVYSIIIILIISSVKIKKYIISFLSYDLCRLYTSYIILIKIVFNMTYLYVLYK